MQPRLPLSHLRPDRHAWAVLVTAALLPLLPLAQAQTQEVPAGPGTDKKEEAIVLSAFEVRAFNLTRYQMPDASSGGRVSIPVMDLPGSINVVTSELLRDGAANRLLDAVKFTAGVTEGITPNGIERVTIRGFQSDNTVTDGFRTGAGQMNTDPDLIDRVEVMKGPNAILQPQGTPGGTVNAITKSPSFDRTGGYFRLQLGQYDSNRSSLDYSGLLGSRVAYRLVLSGQDNEGWWDESFTKSWAVMPSLMFKLGESTRLTVKALASDYRVATYGGIPVDPSVGTDDELITFRGVSRQSNMRGEEETRQDNREEVSTLLTSRIGEHLSVRFAGRFLNLKTIAYGTNPALSAGGAVNPLTGKWTGGVIYGPAPTFTPSPAPAVNPVAARSGGDTHAFFDFLNLQNDYAYKRSFGSIDSTTTAGWAYATSSQDNYVRVGSRGTVDITNTRASQDVPSTFANWGQIDKFEFEETQAYLQEQLSVLDGRMLVGAGVSSLWTERSRRRTLQTPGVLEVIPRSHKNSFNYGVVGKPLPNLSLYFGHSENAVLTGNFDGVAAGTAPLFAEGIQDEIGVKAAFAENRISVSAAYFEIAQTQYGMDDPRNYVSPPPVPRLPAIFTERTGRGWEFSVNAAVTKSLNVVGNIYHGKNRDPNGIPFQAAPDDSAAIYARYDIQSGSWKGFGFSLSADYLGKRPGIQASGYTAASTPTNLIPVQPSFYVPARTLASAGFFYSRGQYDYQINIENLLDRDYVTGTFTRTGVWIGTPRNVKVSLTRRF